MTDPIALDVATKLALSLAVRLLAGFAISCWVLIGPGHSLLPIVYRSLKLDEPRESWGTVVPIAAIDFVNYVLLCLYSSRGLICTAVLGGRCLNGGFSS